MRLEVLTEYSDKSRLVIGCRSLLAPPHPCTVHFAEPATGNDGYRLLSLKHLCCETPQSICRTKHGPLSASSDNKGCYLTDPFLLERQPILPVLPTGIPASGICGVGDEKYRRVARNLEEDRRLCAAFF